MLAYFPTAFDHCQFSVDPWFDYVRRHDPDVMEPRNQSVTFFAGAVKMTPEVTSMILFLVVVSSALYLATTDANANDSFFGELMRPLL